VLSVSTSLRHYAAGEDKRVRVWRGDDSGLLCILKGHGDWVSDLVINDDNSILCSASLDGSIIVWRVARVMRQEPVFLKSAETFLHDRE